MSRRMWFYPLMLCVMLMMSASVMAQAQGGGGFGGQGGQGGQGQDGQGGRRGRGGVENTMLYIREQLAATDEEWSVLQPRVQALLTAQQEVQSGRGGRQGRGGGGGGGGRGGGGQGGQQGGGGFQGQDNPVSRAMQALREALANAASPNELITSRLAALRDARARAENNLTAAQKALKDLLTARQEAMMVTLGYMP